MSNMLIKKLFEHNNVDYRSINLLSFTDSSTLELPKQSQINCSLLASGSEFYIALNPANHKFNLSKLNKVIGKDLHSIAITEKELLKNTLINKLSKEQNPVKGIHFFIDEALECQDELYIVDDDEEHAYAVDIKQLQKLSSDELIGLSFSEEIKMNKDAKETVSFKERVKALHTLPPMPETASQILTLRAIPDVRVEQIAAVIEKDPILVAQIVSYANSAFFGQAGSVKSINDAIFRVLGVDAVMNMALALSVGSTFKIPQTGPVGAKAIWKSSVYSALLMQRLSMLMPWGERLNPGTAYLVGLLHDVGLLVLGHLFTAEYIAFNHYLEKNNQENIFRAEEQILGITHAEVGKMAMRMWNMPDELIVVSTYLHENNYSGEYQKYIQLLSVVKALLAPHGLVYGDSSEELSIELLNKLNLDEEEVIIAADEVLDESEIIQNLVTQMCA